MDPVTVAVELGMQDMERERLVREYLEALKFFDDSIRDLEQQRNRLEVRFAYAVVDLECTFEVEEV